MSSWTRASRFGLERTAFALAAGRAALSLLADTYCCCITQLLQRDAATAGRVPLVIKPMDTMLSVVDVFRLSLTVFPLEIIVLWWLWLCILTERIQVRMWGSYSSFWPSQTTNVFEKKFSISRISGVHTQKAQRDKLPYPLLPTTDISLPGLSWGLEKSLLSCPDDLYNRLKQLSGDFAFPSVRAGDRSDALQYPAKQPVLSHHSPLLRGRRDQIALFNHESPNLSGTAAHKSNHLCN